MNVLESYRGHDDASINFDDLSREQLLEMQKKLQEHINSQEEGFDKIISSVTQDEKSGGLHLENLQNEGDNKRNGDRDTIPSTTNDTISADLKCVDDSASIDQSPILQTKNKSSETLKSDLTTRVNSTSDDDGQISTLRRRGRRFSKRVSFGAENMIINDDGSVYSSVANIDGEIDKEDWDIESGGGDESRRDQHRIKGIISKSLTTGYFYENDSCEVIDGSVGNMGVPGVPSRRRGSINGVIRGLQTLRRGSISDIVSGTRNRRRGSLTDLMSGAKNRKQTSYDGVVSRGNSRKRGSGGGFMNGAAQSRNWGSMELDSFFSEGNENRRRRSISSFVNRGGTKFDPLRSSLSTSFLNVLPPTRKKRIIALHGKESNSDVTILQLENLKITPEKYDIVCINGPIEERCGDPDAAGLVSGPFYSWFCVNEEDPNFKASVLYAVSYIMKEILLKGPFDAIFGFSQGATIASIIAMAHLDPLIRRSIISNFDDINFGPNGQVLEDEEVTIECSDRRQLMRLLHSKSRGSMKSIKRSVASMKSCIMSSAVNLNNDMFVREKPFGYMVLVCTARVTDKILDSLGIEKEHFFTPESVDIPSMHLIGTSDPLRQRGEMMLDLFVEPQLRYMVGGHGVPRSVENDKEVLRMLHYGLSNLRNLVSVQFSDARKVSDVSSLYPMYGYQVAGVELEHLMFKPTIPKLLGVHDANKPFIYNARETESSKFLSYGDLLDFIQGGPGDLRRLGVKKGDVVAYGGPGNGGAIAAVAFLSIASQATAAPIAPTTTEVDAMYLLDLYDAQHLILFDDVDYKGLEEVYDKMLASRKINVHRAKFLPNDKPGVFEFVKSGNRSVNKTWVPNLSVGGPLVNPSDGVGLLLSTSGTTSKPKGVPIRHGSLVHNGQIIGSNLRLTPEDVCYSVMPLFHIGGIAASVMCTAAMGGSICCDGEGYNPERMVDALAMSNPQPTWYSSVPTIHNSTVGFIKTMAETSSKLQGYGISKDGVWKKGHSLRFIRSGAAVLLAPDAALLAFTYGDVPIIPTYSMSEQMPISQPPAGVGDIIMTKPGSVGVPVAATLAIVNPISFKILPYGTEGEIAICGSSVIDCYLDNKGEDAKAFFTLTLPVKSSSCFSGGRFFLTGDVGVLDKEGFLTLKGRNKEMIKKGGEQITPVEVEELLQDHPSIKIVLCFSVPSTIYGEEVGCAIVLTSSASADASERSIAKEMKKLLQIKGLPPLKWPTRWILVDEGALPKTKSNKFIRIGLAKVLGLEESDMNEVSLCSRESSAMKNAFIDWHVISGFRFLLSCYVMFMHIGSDHSWGAMSNLRGWPWHVHVFFTLIGWSMAAPMNPHIKKKFKYFMARMGSIYPMYMIGLIFALINLLVTCRPSTFRPGFSWHSKPDDLYIDGYAGNGLSPLFCEGTLATPNSYWGSLTLTIFVYILGVPITPAWLLHWWMAYYFWFLAMYYQCLMVFPVTYNFLLKRRGDLQMYFSLVVSLLVLNVGFLTITWFNVKDAAGYNIYDANTGDLKSIDAYNNDAFVDNAIVLGWYLFSPFWMLYFFIGTCAAFLYDAYRPTETSSCHRWGYIADMCTFTVAAWSISLILQGTNGYNLAENHTLRPDEANNFTDTSYVSRIWDNICGRLVAPLTVLWIFALSTGKGYTASILRMPFLVEIIAPHSYGCFLFHQMVGQWYYAATREGHWWNWWRYRKNMYWFSPSPCPVEWYEYFYIVGLTVSFSALINATLQPFISDLLILIKTLIFGKSEEEIDVEEALLGAIEDMAGFAPELDWSLDQCGLSSVGLPVLASKLSKTFSTKTDPFNVTIAALSHARTIKDLVEVMEELRNESRQEGI